MDNYNLTYPNNHYNSVYSTLDAFRNKYRKVSTGFVVDNRNADKNNTEQKEGNKKMAATALVAGLGLLFMSKGVQKNSKKALEILKSHFEEKIDANALNKTTPKISFYEYSVKKIDSFIKKSESINNFNSVKDILFMRFMYSSGPTKKIHKGITGFFEKLSINSVKSSYKKTQKTFDRMNKDFDKLDDYILKNCADETVEFQGSTLTKRELVERAKDYRESVNMVVDSFISDSTQKARYDYIKGKTSNLRSDFWDKSFKGFWSKDNIFKGKEIWQTFIAAEQVKGSKTELAENVAFARNMLSYTDKEKTEYLSRYIDNLSGVIQADDNVGLDIIKRLKWFTKVSEYYKDTKQAFADEVNRLEKHEIKLNSDENIAQIQQKDKATNIKLIRNILNDNGTGELQDMLDIYQKIVPFELAKTGALKSAQNAVKSFDKSVNLEVGEFFDKARDLELGSAPTDVLTILTSCGMITYGLSTAKTKDEKKSVMLKSGIPIIGAVAVALVSATKLVSGGKSVALGLISGIMLNQMGYFADCYRKKLNAEA